ncbi:MAG: hypothetical protein HZB18_14455 [Chloroflexi bacterium]|nr:hypothetical protein [Chloroflexota bacterium]
MKSKKWLTYTLGILLTLIVLAAVGGFGFRMGVTQSASFAKLTDGQSAHSPSFAQGHGFDGDFNRMERGNSSHGFDRGRGRDRGGFSPIFGLIRLVVLGALAWLGYKLVRNSGWKLVKANASESPASVTEQPSEAAAGDEEKETE